MDVGGVEQVNVAALGGAGAITVNDLTGTDVTDVSIDLAGTLGRRTGDRGDSHCHGTDIRCNFDRRPQGRR
jgi:hypothetical protein